MPPSPTIRVSTRSAAALPASSGIAHAAATEASTTMASQGRPSSRARSTSARGRGRCLSRASRSADAIASRRARSEAPKASSERSCAAGAVRCPVTGVPRSRRRWQHGSAHPRRPDAAPRRRPTLAAYRGDVYTRAAPQGANPPRRPLPSGGELAGLSFGVAWPIALHSSSTISARSMIFAPKSRLGPVRSQGVRSEERTGHTAFRTHTLPPVLLRLDHRSPTRRPARRHPIRHSLARTGLRWNSSRSASIGTRAPKPRRGAARAPTGRCAPGTPHGCTI